MSDGYSRTKVESKNRIFFQVSTLHSDGASVSQSSVDNSSHIKTIRIELAFLCELMMDPNHFGMKNNPLHQRRVQMKTLACVSQRFNSKQRAMKNWSTQWHRNRVSKQTVIVATHKTENIFRKIWFWCSRCFELNFVEPTECSNISQMEYYLRIIECVNPRRRYIWWKEQ